MNRRRIDMLNSLLIDLNNELLCLARRPDFTEWDERQQRFFTKHGRIVTHLWLISETLKSLEVAYKERESYDEERVA